MSTARALSLVALILAVLSLVVHGRSARAAARVAPDHPYVGVARDVESGEMTAYPICQACWATPAHRQRVLKMHFFHASQAPEAVQAAADNILVDPP